MSTGSSSHSEGSPYVDLVNWLKEGGYEFPHISIKEYDELLLGGGRGVYCECDVEPETLVMKLPLKYLITVDVAKSNCSVGRMMRAEEERGMKLIEMNDEIICGDCGDGGLDIAAADNGDEGSSNDDDIDDIDELEEGGDLEGDGNNGGTTNSGGKHGAASDSHDPMLIEDGDEACEVWGLDVSSPPHCYLTVFILEDRKNLSSEYQHYYKTLPESLSSVPIFWPEEEIELFKGSFFRRQIEDRKASLRYDYDVICKIAPHFPTIATYEEFCWMMMIVASRNFGLEINGLSKLPCLVPFGDMLNHRRPRQTKWSFDEDLQAFIVVADQPLKAGEQIFDSYGKKCNSRYLINYGFVVEDNSDPDGHCYNESRFLLQLDEQDPGLRVKKLLFGRQDAVGPAGEGKVTWGRGVRLSNYHNDDSSREALSLARFICAQGKELLRLPLVSEADLQVMPIAPLSAETEMRVLTLLRKLGYEQLGRYEWQYDEEPPLSGSDGSAVSSLNRRNARILLEGEKQVYRHWIHVANTCVPVLQYVLERSVPLWEILQKCEEELLVTYLNSSEADPMSKYIQVVIMPLIRDFCDKSNDDDHGGSGGRRYSNSISKNSRRGELSLSLSPPTAAAAATARTTSSSSSAVRQGRSRTRNNHSSKESSPYSSSTKKIATNSRKTKKSAAEKPKNNGTTTDNNSATGTQGTGGGGIRDNGNNDEDGDSNYSSIDGEEAFETENNLLTATNMDDSLHVYADDDSDDELHAAAAGSGTGTGTSYASRYNNWTRIDTVLHRQHKQQQQRQQRLLYGSGGATNTTNNNKPRIIKKIKVKTGTGIGTGSISDADKGYIPRKKLLP